MDRRLLDALAFPHAKDFNFASRGDIVILVSWLEDRKIRELEIEERESLRRDHIGWDEVFSGYLNRLGCPFVWKSTNTLDCLNWLVAYSVSTEYEDCAEACLNLEAAAGEDEEEEFAAGDGGGGEMEVTPEVENVALHQEVDKLGALVHLTRLPEEENVEFLQRAARQVRLLLTPGSIHALSTNGSEGISLQHFPLGFDTKDEVVNQLAVVLRMLYLLDFRELQNDLNALIVLGQEFTANPKTSSTLGAVGK